MPKKDYTFSILIIFLLMFIYPVQFPLHEPYFDLTPIKVLHTKTFLHIYIPSAYKTTQKKSNLLHLLFSAPDEWLVPNWEKIHRDDGDSRLLVIPFSCSRVTDYNP